MPFYFVVDNLVLYISPCVKINQTLLPHGITKGVLGLAKRSWNKNGYDSSDEW